MKSKKHNLRRQARRQVERLFYADSGKCHWCECDLSLDLYQEEIPYATVDHVYPIELGGDSNPSNIVTSCSKCNQWRNIAWQSYGLLLYASQEVIQRQLSGRQKIAGDKLACRTSRQMNSEFEARKVMMKKIKADSIPEAIASKFQPYRCKYCNYWHWRKFRVNG